MNNGDEKMPENIPVKRGIFGWLRKRAMPIAGLVLVLGIMAAIFYVKYTHPDIIDELENYGYLGAFVISIIFNATLILPAGNMLIQMTLGATMLNPVLLGVVSGGGAAIGEITGYVAGRSGRGLIAKSRMYTQIEEWVRKWGVLTIFVFSIVPVVFDLVGIAAGALRVPFWKFFIACMLGRMVLYVIMICLASQGYEWILSCD